MTGLIGIHHLTAVTADLRANHAFYTGVLGLRLVKKTVNQDDVSAYHLFYADAVGSPGTDITFFDFPAAQPERRGTNAIVRTGFRVAGPDALDWWAARLDATGVARGAVRTVDGRAELAFTDPDGQRLALVDDSGAAASATPWPGSTVPVERQIRGLGPVAISVPVLAPTAAFLVDVLGMREARRYDAADAAAVAVHVFAVGDGGPGAELHVRVEPGLERARPGSGGAHHVAFRVADADYAAWVERYARLGVRSSGPVDRFWFRSLYAREPGGVLIEIATDGPGFGVDEAADRLGEHLVLPPFLEKRRGQIEREIRPLTF